MRVVKAVLIFFIVLILYNTAVTDVSEGSAWRSLGLPLVVVAAFSVLWRGRRTRTPDRLSPPGSKPETAIPPAGAFHRQPLGLAAERAADANLLRAYRGQRDYNLRMNEALDMWNVHGLTDEVVDGITLAFDVMERNPDFDGPAAYRLADTLQERARRDLSSADYHTRALPNGGPLRRWVGLYHLAHRNLSHVGPEAARSELLATSDKFFYIANLLGEYERQKNR